MMLALLLAQLVLPWPGLDSPLVQPGPTICVGECAGPVVWGPAERGRLVVACDMRSDTCSDGRQITTVRPTPVPCETSPGVWEIIPADQGCYSVRGLDAWAQNTSYLSWGAELDRGAWGSDSAAVQKLAHGYRVTGDGAASRVFQVIPPDAGTWTFACVADTGASIGARLRIYQEGGTGSVFCNLDSTPGYRTHSCTTTVTGTPTGMSVHVYPGTGYIDVAGCWLTRTSTPGRPCWGGEAPVTCARDRHTIGTEGWPTESGEICLTATVSRTDTAVILDGRPGWVPQGPLLAMQSSGTIRWESDGVRINSHVVAREVPHLVCAGRRDGKLTLSVDGVSVPPIDGPPLAWEPVAVLGDSNGGTSQHIDGPISSLTVRSYEEVSP